MRTDCLHFKMFSKYAQMHIVIEWHYNNHEIENMTYIYLFDCFEPH
jgi:hypothetical protein